MGENGRVSFNSSGLGWFGAVTTSEGPIWTVNADGQVEPSTAVRLEFPALGTPLTVDAACCRIVSQSFTVTNVSGTTLLELDQVPALVALGQVTAKLPERSWIVLALTAEANTTTELSVDNAPANVRSVLASSNVPIFRPLRGIDPSRGALILKEPVARGTRVAFAIRDERMAKRNLEEALRKTRLQLSGSSPRFGLYFEGIGRGRALFGAGNVESSILRQVLGDFPILGSRSNLELEERDGSVVIQSMSGQLALFVSLS
jgi:small ligand-binding sensory domain FIST